MNMQVSELDLSSYPAIIGTTRFPVQLTHSCNCLLSEMCYFLRARTKEAPELC